MGNKTNQDSLYSERATARIIKLVSATERFKAAPVNRYFPSAGEHHYSKVSRLSAGKRSAKFAK